jgi:DNA-binding MarR family transcriptional regulator
MALGWLGLSEIEARRRGRRRHCRTGCLSEVFRVRAACSEIPAPELLQAGKDVPISGFALRSGIMANKANIDSKTLAKLAGLASALHLLPAEIGLPQLLALLTIASEPGLSVNELADRLRMPQQTASRHVAVLAGRYQGMFGAMASEDAGRSKLEPLITQEISQSDPRRRALIISTQGRALLDAMADCLGHGRPRT